MSWMNLLNRTVHESLLDVASQSQINLCRQSQRDLGLPVSGSPRIWRYIFSRIDDDDDDDDDAQQY